MSPILKTGAALLATLLLATPASSQASKPDIDALADQFDDFAPAEPDLPLDKLVDDFLTTEPDASVPPQVATPADAAAVTVPSTDAAGASVAADAGPAASARIPVTPEGWVRHELFGMSFAAPQEWTIIEEGTDNLMVASADMKQKKGIAAGILHEEIKAFEEFPPQMKVTDLADLDLGNGVVFRRKALDGVMDKVPFYGQLLISNQVDEDDEGFVVMISSADVDRDLVDATALQIVASIDAKPIVKAAPEAKDGVDGLVSYTLPKGWSVLFDRNDVLMVKTQPYFSAYLTVSTGDQASKDIAAQTGFNGDIRKRSGEVLGQSVSITEGLAPKAEVQDGGQMVEAFISSRVLDTCLADGSPIVVTLAAAPGWLQKNSFDELLDSIKLMLPDDAAACAAGAGQAAEGAVDHSPVTFQAYDSGGWRGEAATLSAPETGGIDGGSYLAANTPGDGTTGYFVAPARLLGDWSRHSGMRMSLRITSGAGEYYDPFTLGGHGDIHIANGTMNASIAFNDAVTKDWSIKQVQFDGPGWKLSGGAKSIDDVLAQVTAFSIRAEYLIGDTGSGLSTLEFTDRPVGAASAMVAASPSGSPAQDAALATYQNARFGTVIRYPAGLFRALPESENGDGRRFESLDGKAEITVYASHNALARTVPELLGDVLGSGFQSIAATKMEGNRFEVSGVRDGRAIIHAEILDAADVQHVVEIAMDPSVDASTRESLAQVAASLRVEAGAIGTQSSPTPSAGNSAMELAFWNAISNSDDPADFEAYLAQWPNGTFAALAQNVLRRLSSNEPASGQITAPVIKSPSVSARTGYTTPARGTAERSAIMDAARIPVQRDIGQKVIFVVSVLRTDNVWAYLQAVPKRPDGRAIDWTRTPFARDWKADMMSDVVMVLLKKENGRWRAVDHIIGPTDVYWYSWIDRYGLPERLFTPG